LYLHQDYEQRLVFPQPCARDGIITLYYDHFATSQITTTFTASFAFQLCIMSTPFPNATPFDNGTTASTSSAREDLQPQGLPKRTIVIIASAVGAAVVLAVIIGAIHCIRRRRCQQLYAKQQEDIEKSLQPAWPPILALNTDIPRVNERQRSAGTRVTMPELIHQATVLPVPLVHTRSAPLSVQEPSVRVTRLGHSRGRSATRNPLGSLPPGVAGRINRPRPANRTGRFQDFSLRKPVQMYGSCSGRLQYRG
jgi:hypothetical protein